MRADIKQYNEGLNEFRALADELYLLLESLSNTFEVKIWHNTVVFFDDKNPLYGYSLKKKGLELMFWSGKDFLLDQLRPTGSFKAAVIDFKASDKLPVELIEKLVECAKTTQYDYKN